MRKEIIAVGEYYHVYNRGTDKRNIFSEQEDVDRFLQSMMEFNAMEPIGSIYENSFVKKEGALNDKEKLVEFIAFSLVGNHFHFIVRSLSEKGVEKYMQRLGNGYTKYFNNKYKRSGALFQGKYKAKHINSDVYLLHLSAYVNLNQAVHSNKQQNNLKLFSSWQEYSTNYENKDKICSKEIILDRFNKKSDYVDFAESSLKDIIERKEREKELKELIIE